MNIGLLARRLGVKSQAIERKANELLRMANQRLSAGLGMGEICKPAVCFELACTVLGEPVEHAKIVRMSGCTEKIYNSSFVTLQRILNVKQRITTRELCMKFGCVRLEEACKRALATYKQRFTARLPSERRASADFGRSVFPAGVFYLVARKNKVKVEREQLQSVAGVTGEEFGSAINSMADLLFDIVGVEQKKRKAGDVKSNRGLLDATAGEGGGSDSDDSDVDVAEGEEEVPQVAHNKKVRRRREYEEWKGKVLAMKAPAGGGGAGGEEGDAAGSDPAEETKRLAALKQATLGFAAKPREPVPALPAPSPSSQGA